MRGTASRGPAAWILKQPELLVFDDVLERLARLDCSHTPLDAPAHRAMVADRRGEEREQIQETPVLRQGGLVYANVGVVAEANQFAVNFPDLPPARLDHEVGTKGNPLSFQVDVPHLALLFLIEAESENRRYPECTVVLLHGHHVVVARQDGRQGQYRSAGAD